jgi:hypothetical protein
MEGATTELWRFFLQHTMPRKESGSKTTRQIGHKHLTTRVSESDRPSFATRALEIILPGRLPSSVNLAFDNLY